MHFCFQLWLVKYITHDNINHKKNYMELIELNQVELKEINGGRIHPLELIYHSARLGWDFGKWLAEL